MTALVNQWAVFMKIIETIKYSGSINNFRAFMDEITLLHQEIWVVENKNYYHSRDTTYEKQYRSIWDIIEATEGGIIWAKVKCGVILALEKLPNETTVQFIDGKTTTGLFLSGLDSPPIGDDFLVIIEKIVDELENKVRSERDDKNEPLNKIPNVGWYREAVNYGAMEKHQARLPRKSTKTSKLLEIKSLSCENFMEKMSFLSVDKKYIPVHS